MGSLSWKGLLDHDLLPQLISLNLSEFTLPPSTSLQIFQGFDLCTMIQTVFLFFTLFYHKLVCTLVNSCFYSPYICLPCRFSMSFWGCWRWIGGLINTNLSSSAYWSRSTIYRLSTDQPLCMGRRTPQHGRQFATPADVRSDWLKVRMDQ